MVKTRRISILGSLKNTFTKTLKKIRGNRKTKAKGKRVKRSSRKTKRRKSKGGDPYKPDTIVYKGVKGLKSFAHSNYNPIRLVSKGVKGAYNQASDFIGNKYDEFKYGKNTPN